jgi:hypothetical protein
MKNYALLLSFAILSITPQVINAQKISAIKNIKYCDAFDNADKNQVIRTKAFMTLSTVSRVDGGDSFLFSTHCNSGDYFAVVKIKRNLEKLPWYKFLENLKSEKNYVFEVEFIGKLETSFPPSFGHLSWSRAEIQILNIIKFKDVSKSKNLPDYTANAPIIEVSAELTTLMPYIMYLLFRTDSMIDSGNRRFLLSDNFIISDDAGNKENAENSRRITEKMLNNKSLINKSSVNIKEIKKIDETYMVSGTYQFFTSENESLKIFYENNFSYSSQTWTLNSTKLSKL